MQAQLVDVVHLLVFETLHLQILGTKRLLVYLQAVFFMVKQTKSVQG